MGEQLQLLQPAVDSERLLDGLDQEQREVAMHGEGPCLVVASAGSGKSTAITRRIAYMIRAYGISPERILATTFTRAGAEVMSTRTSALLGGDTRATVKTFHALCRAILIKEFPRFEAWTLEESEDPSSDHRGQRKSYRYLAKMAVSPMKWRSFDLEDFLGFVELVKAEGHRPATPEARAIAVGRYRIKRDPKRDPDSVMTAYDLTEAARVKEFMMTFADWMLETRDLLRENNAALERWRAKFDYIMADEVQDNSLVQCELLEMLGAEHRNVLVVGDNIQSLYGFRGAAVELFNSFHERWQGTKILHLHRNYRSAQKIVELGNQVRDKASQDDATRLLATCVRPEEGRVTVSRHTTQDDEAAGVAERIKDAHDRGAKWSDCAVLYRVASLSRAHEEALSREGIPYRVVGGRSFYFRKEVKALLSWLRVVSRRMDKDDLRRSLREPTRYLRTADMDSIVDAVEAARREFRAGRQVPSFEEIVRPVIEKLPHDKKRSAGEWFETVVGMRQIIDEAAAARKSLEQDPDKSTEFRADPRVLAIQVAKPGAILRSIVEDTDFKSWLEKDEGQNSVDNDRVANIAELIRVADRFQGTNELIDHVAAALEARDVNAKSRDSNRVTLCSCHASKGLQWPHVFVVGACNGIMPHARAEDIEEERRVYYVGVSRAMDTLDISYFTRALGTDGKPREIQPSPYIHLGSNNDIIQF